MPKSHPAYRSRETPVTPPMTDDGLHPSNPTSSDPGEARFDRCPRPQRLRRPNDSHCPVLARPPARGPTASPVVGDAQYRSSIWNNRQYSRFVSREEARRQNKVTVWALALACVIGTAPWQEILAQPLATIILEEERVWLVPRSFEPTNVFLCPNGQTLLYARGSRSFIALDDAFAPIAGGTLPNTMKPLAMIVDRVGQLEIIAGEPPSTVAVSLDGTVLARTPISIPGRLVNATYVSVIRKDPKAGYRSLDGRRSVVFRQCGGAIVARRYDRSLERKMRRESTVIIV